MELVRLELVGQQKIVYKVFPAHLNAAGAALLGQVAVAVRLINV